jgi:UDP-N-acetylglucosamine 2-epimerase (non-hydrolysing)
LDLDKGKYFLVTAHRQGNVDFKEKLKKILSVLEKIYRKYKVPMVYPVHPRTKKRIKEFNLKTPKGVRLIEPLGYLDFLKLESNAKLVLTDSGGIQQEACTLKIPCVTLRENTESPETVEVGSNMIAGLETDKIFKSINQMLEKNNDWRNPFGDGTASKQIIEIILA